MTAMMKNGVLNVPTHRIMMSVTVDRPAIRLYHEWRHLTGSQAASSRSIGFSRATSAVATIRVPRIAATGALTAGEAELSMDIPGLLIAWSSRPMSGSVQSGEVWFSPLPSDCAEVRLILTWQSEGPALVESAETAVQVQRELTRFKQLMEQ